MRVLLLLPRPVPLLRLRLLPDSRGEPQDQRQVQGQRQVQDQHQGQDIL